MNDLKEKEKSTADEFDKTNYEIQRIKNKSDDTRLQGFYDDETECVRYRLYPDYCRKFISYIRSLPDEYQLSCQTLNVVRLGKDIDEKIAAGKGREEVWHNLKGMLATITRLCPPKYSVLPLDEQYLARCEDEGKTRIDGC